MNKTVDQLKEEASNKLKTRIRELRFLYQQQEQSVVFAILEDKETVWITKEGGAKVQFKIEEAERGLSTLRNSIVTKQLLYQRLSGKTYKDSL